MMGKIDAILVDNDPKMLELMSGVLIKHGLSVAVANSGEEALSLIGKNSCRVVITNISMPIMTGIELSKRLSQKLPIVMLKGLDYKLNAEIEHYCDCFIDKVEVVDRLYDATQKAIERHQLNGENHKIAA